MWNAEILKFLDKNKNRVTCKCTNMFHSKERISSLSPLATSSSIIAVPSSSYNFTPACLRYCSAMLQFTKFFLCVSDGTTIFCQKSKTICHKNIEPGANK